MSWNDHVKAEFENRLMDKRMHESHKIDEIRKQLREERKKRKVLIDWINRLGKRAHRPECYSNVWGPNDCYMACNCGLDKVIKGKVKK